jgi:hypothetical protein
VSALKAVSNVLEVRLKMGYNIKLDGIWTFSLTVTGEGYDTKRNVSLIRLRLEKLLLRLILDSKLRKQIIGIKFYKTEIKHSKKK